MRIGEFVAEYIREPAPASVEKGPTPTEVKEIKIGEDIRVGDPLPSEVSTEVPAKV